jgi:hypothetical protein
MFAGYYDSKPIVRKSQCKLNRFIGNLGSKEIYHKHLWMGHENLVLE